MKNYISVLTADGHTVAFSRDKAALYAASYGILWCKDRATWHSLFNVQVLCQVPGAFIVKH